MVLAKGQSDNEKSILNIIKCQMHCKYVLNTSKVVNFLLQS